jgi:hypothetical protein
MAAAASAKKHLHQIKKRKIKGRTGIDILIEKDIQNIYAGLHAAESTYRCTGRAASSDCARNRAERNLPGRCRKELVSELGGLLPK